MNLQEYLDIIKCLHEKKIYSQNLIDTMIQFSLSKKVEEESLVAINKEYDKFLEESYNFEYRSEDSICYTTFSNPYEIYCNKENVSYEWIDFYEKNTGLKISSKKEKQLSSILKYILRNFNKKIPIVVNIIKDEIYVDFHDSSYKFFLKPDSKAGFGYKKIK